MSIYHWILLISGLVCAVAGLFLWLQILKSAGTRDPSEAKGKALPAVLYSLTAAMSPLKKESARHHLLTYCAGMFFHAGIFLSFFWLILQFFDVSLIPMIATASAVIIFLSAVCGVVILIKRIISPKMRYFSNPDDYFSNLIVTGFLILMGLSLLLDGLQSVLFIYTGVLLLYVPLGKLRHAIYFVLTRTYLGLFYGKRGVWPKNRRNAWQTK
ncbi:MAG: hypothetical protein GY869_11845 [Planctomycetes bacterium]|nr:hypothetical protein [Planctomycetota bacterium]